MNKLRIGGSLRNFKVFIVYRSLVIKHRLFFLFRLIYNMDVDNYQFGVGLEEAALNEINFLKNVNKYPGLYGGPLVKRAIYRYGYYHLRLASILTCSFHAYTLSKTVWSFKET